MSSSLRVWMAIFPILISAPALAKKKTNASVYSISYGVKSDLIRENEQRVYSHRVQGRWVRELSREAYFNLGGSFFYQTVEDSISRSHDQDAYFDFQDIDLGVGYTQKIKNTVFLVNYFAGLYLPTSEDSRYEGYKAATYGGTDIAMSFFKSAYIVSNEFSFDYIANTYYYSPVSDQINPDLSTSYRLKQKFEFYPNVYFLVSFGFKATHHLDGFWKYSYGNTESLVYEATNYSIALSYTNSGYNDRGEIDLWFIDKRHKRLGLSAMYRF